MRDMKICYNNKNYKIKLLTIYLQSPFKEEECLLMLLTDAFLLYLVQGVLFSFSFALLLLFYGTLLTILPIYFTMNFYHSLSLFSSIHFILLFVFRKLKIKLQVQHCNIKWKGCGI